MQIMHNPGMNGGTPWDYLEVSNQLWPVEYLSYERLVQKAIN